MTWLSLSNDSTCHNQLWSHNTGHQTIQLHTLQPPAARSERCADQSPVFPYWSQGDWTEVSVDAGTMLYRDHLQFVQYELRLVSSVGGGYLVRAGAGQCGGALSGYTCVSLQRRNDHVMEMMMGEVVTSVQEAETMCDLGLRDKTWVTLTRAGHSDNTGHVVHVSGGQSDACPLLGEYSGTLPDSEALCAR